MTVRAKFKVARIERHMGSKQVDKEWVPCEIQTVVLSPVYSPDPESENRKFWDASPSGEIKLGTINPEAWEHFDLNQEFYIDFIPVPVES